MTVGPMTSLLFFVPLWGPEVTLKGFLHRRSKGAGEVSQYSIVDFLVLFSMLSIASAFSTAQKSEIASSLVLLCGSNLLAALMWYKCIRLMSNNGISHNFYRIITQLIVHPSSILSISYLIISVLMLISAILGTTGGETPPDMFIFAVLGMLLASICWIFLTRRIYSWIVALQRQKTE